LVELFLLICHKLMLIKVMMQLKKYLFNLSKELKSSVQDLAKRVNFKETLSLCPSSVGIPLGVLWVTGTCLCLYSIRTVYYVSST
jgi:hypothetical protein